jgi:NADH pyrophosphatase NudC (nudix superfamily)
MTKIKHCECKTWKEWSMHLINKQDIKFCPYCGSKIKEVEGNYRPYYIKKIKNKGEN